MKQNKIIIMALVALMLLFSACGGGDTPTTNTPVYKPFVGGDSGITFEFMPGMPSDIPGAISDNGNEFAIGVKLTNDGEYDIDAETDGDYLKLELKGIKPEYYGLTNADLIKYLEEDLKGSRKNIDGTILKGDFNMLAFEGLSYKSDIQGDLPVNFMVDICYDYGTKSSTRICVADDVNKALVDENDQKICMVSANQETQNSAGPVKVQNMRQSPSGGSKISILFDIARIGFGDIYLFENENGCDSNTDKDKIKVVVSLPEQSTALLECTGFTQGPDGLEKVMTVFKESPQAITCRITGEEGEDNVYLENLNVNLYYRYNEQISKSVIVKDTGANN